MVNKLQYNTIHQECINGTVSALERLKCKIYEVSIQIE